jgi:hypothetical protein
VPMTPAIGGYRGRQIYFRQPGIPRIGLPKVPDRTQLLYEDKSRRRMIQIDQWTDPNPWVNLFYMAELLATREVAPQPVAPGVPIYTFRGDRTLVAYLQGAVVRLASVGATQLNMRTVFTQVSWPGAALEPPLRLAVRGTKPTATRGRKR